MERKCEEGMERKGKKEKGWWGGGWEDDGSSP